MTFSCFTYLALGLGFAAWALGFAAVLHRGSPRSILFSFFSFALTLASLLCPLWGLAELEKQESFSQLYDMTSGLVFGGIILILVTLLLNGAALFSRRKS